MIRGSSEEKLRYIVIATAQTMERDRGILRSFDGDVAPRIASAHDQHPPPSKNVRYFVLRRVQNLTVELAWVFGPLGIPIVAVGDHHPPILAPPSVGQYHQPGVIHRLDPLDRCLQFDMFIQPEMPSVRA